MSKYVLSFVRPVKPNMASPSLTSLSFLVRNWGVLYLIVGRKGIICSLFHSMARWMCLIGSAPEDSCFINQAGLQPALQIDPWDITCCRRNCSSYYFSSSSDNNANTPTHSWSGYRTKDASTYKKLMTNRMLHLRSFSPVFWVYTSLSTEVIKKKKDSWGN